MSDKKEQFSVRLNPERAQVIQRHLRLHDAETTADALRAAVDALAEKHTNPAADASRKHNIRSNDDTNTLGLDP